jgi:outer membrane protein, multidrug efflux system
MLENIPIDTIAAPVEFHGSAPKLLPRRDGHRWCMDDRARRWRSSVSPMSMLAGLLVSGCASMQPHERPPLPMPPAYARASVAPAVPVRASDVGWQSFFGDERLKTLIGTALANNRDLMLAVRRVDEARALYGIERADRWPALNGSVSASRSRDPAELSASGRATVSNQYQVALGSSAWELDFWGRVRSLEVAALESFLASDEARRAAQVSLIAQVARIYLSESELDERIDLTERSLATRQEAERIARRRFEVGSAARVDAVQAAILVSQARAEWTALQRQREQNRHALELLVGTPLPAERRTLSRLENGFTLAFAAGLPSDLLIQRPDLREAERRLKAANANIGAARAAFFPRITLIGSLGVASRELDGLFKSGSTSWSLAPSLSVPLFDGGLNQAGLDLARARRELALAEYERSVQNAFREVADALAERHWLAEQVQAQRVTLEAQRERGRIAALRYGQGAATYLEVLDAQRDLFAAEQSLVQTRRAHLASSINLYAALGGGDAPADAVDEQKR